MRISADFPGRTGDLSQSAFMRGNIGITLEMSTGCFPVFFTWKVTVVGVSSAFSPANWISFFLNVNTPDCATRLPVKSENRRIKISFIR